MILKRCIQYIKTIKYLKPVQIVYQMRYRFFGYGTARVKNIPQGIKEFPVMIPALDLDDAYVERFHTEKIIQDQIVLLHKSMDWRAGRWEDASKTHLWNFNLHYFEYAVAMGAMFRNTQDIIYYEKFRQLYYDWHRTCMDKAAGDAWHPYTISMRLPNLFICLELFRDRFADDGDFFQVLTGDIYRQYRFLLKNQEKNLLGNHYFENLKTIYLCSSYYQEENVRIRCREALLGEIKEQIPAEGMHYERSFLYHHIILEDLLRISMAAGRTEEEPAFLHELRAAVCRMTDCIFSFESVYKEHIPLFNDAAANAAKSAVRLMEAVSDLYGYKPVNRDCMEEAGYYKLENDSFYILFDNGRMGPDYLTGHGHCDALSFELFHRGKPIFVNSGTFQYQTPLRSYFRSTRAHNTLQAAGSEQSECWGEHRTAGRVRIMERKFVPGSFVGGKIGTYDGHILSRTIRLADRIVAVTDLTKTAGRALHSYLHLHPSCRAEVDKKGQRAKIISGNHRLTVELKDAGGRILLHREDDLCWYSEEFGKLEKTSVLEITAERKGCIAFEIREMDCGSMQAEDDAERENTDD